MKIRYKVRDPLGRSHEGQVEAVSQEDARQLLQRDGFEVMEIFDGKDDGELFPRRIKKSELIYAVNQLAIMIDTGVSLSLALHGLSEQEENLTLKKVLLDLKGRVEQGDDFSTALACHPKHFDRTFVSLIKASEQTGSLGAMLDRIANHMQNEQETQAKVRSAMAYPSVMLCLAIGVTIFLLTFIMPKFTPLFLRKGIALPKPTEWMMMTSEGLVHYWWVWLLVSSILIGGFMLGRRTDRGRKVLDWVKIHIPVFGPLYRKVTISRGIRTLATMLKSGVSVLDAIRLTAEVSGNYYYERVWTHVLRELTQGSQICDALDGNPLFPHTLIQMISSGEETGKLDYVLGKVSSYYDREVETALKTTTSLIEPIMITGMGAVVGTIGMSIMLPIFSLSRGAG